MDWIVFAVLFPLYVFGSLVWLGFCAYSGHQFLLSHRVYSQVRRDQEAQG